MSGRENSPENWRRPCSMLKEEARSTGSPRISPTAGRDRNNIIESSPHLEKTVFADPGGGAAAAKDWCNAKGGTSPSKCLSKSPLPSASPVVQNRWSTYGKYAVVKESRRKAGFGAPGGRSKNPAAGGESANADENGWETHPEAPGGVSCRRLKDGETEKEAEEPACPEASTKARLQKKAFGARRGGSILRSATEGAGNAVCAEETSKIPGGRLPSKKMDGSASRAVYTALEVR